LIRVLVAASARDREIVGADQVIKAARVGRVGVKDVAVFILNKNTLKPEVRADELSVA